MTDPLKTNFLEVVGLVGAAGALAGAIILIGGDRYRRWALLAFFVVLLVGLGVVGWLEAVL